MSRHAFLNGTIVPFDKALIPVNDRGFNFGDGVYEVTAVVEGRLIDNEAHLARLDRSLSAIGIPNPYANDEWTAHQESLVQADVLDQGVVYLQVTRGIAERDFAIPKPALSPTVVMFAQPKDIIGSALAQTGARVVTVPEFRWLRREIKATSLLAAVMAKQVASEAGASEAWFLEDGLLTEGASSNIFAIGRDGTLLTRDLSNALLGGITRQAVIEIAAEQGLRVEERPFGLNDVLEAQECFTTSASTFVTPVISVNGQMIADGQPGPLTRSLRERYVELARSQEQAG